MVGVTLYEATTKSHSAIKYRVTDPIDLPVAIIEAFHRCCEWKLEINRHGKSFEAEKRYRDELFRAFGIKTVKIDVRPDDRGNPWAWSPDIPYDPYQLSAALT